MAKSRYGISAVQYDDNHNRIENVQAYVVSPDNKLSDLKIYSREAVIKAIEEKGISMVTLPIAHDGKFTIGADVAVIAVGNDMFIKTVNNQTRDDNLGDLPEFQG